ncbi:MAG TPA: lysine-sensitive aspartokinase 3 [Balneolales bacterium]|nr:lysine-sensitive aspartokinase 3 [Balneolales bacterium]
MKVLKFGGTSMADESTWMAVLNIIKDSDTPFVVVSATSGTTNSLLEAAELARLDKVDEAYALSEIIKQKHYDVVRNFLEQNNDSSEDILFDDCCDWIDKHIAILNNFLLGISTLGELTPRSIDTISSIGERISSYLLAKCGTVVGLNTVYVDARDILKTDSNFGQAKPNLKALGDNVRLLLKHHEKGNIPIIGGFYGSDYKGNVTTLGRGGSDYTASLIGMAAKADMIEIWTDVSGMYTSDPRYIEHTQFIEEIGFNQAAELAYFGAKVLHPATIQPAIDQNIPVFVKNTFEPDHRGTKISSDAKMDDIVRAIAFKKDITIITISSSRMLMAYGFLARVFDIFEEHRVPVDLVSTSEVSISMSIDDASNLDELIKALEEIGDVKTREEQALISVIGVEFLDTSGLASRAFGVLNDIPIHLISQGSSDINLSLVVDNDKAIEAVQLLHNEFFQPAEKMAK